MTICRDNMGATYCAHCEEVEVLSDGEYCSDDCRIAAGLTECEHCGLWIEYPYETADGAMLCGDCILDQTTDCEHCGNRYYSDEYTYYVDDADGYVCQTCLDNYYVSCEDCHDLIHHEHAIYAEYAIYCQCCGERHLTITDYGYQPDEWIMHPSDATAGYGIELEIDKGHSQHECASDILEYPHISHCSYDGSLGGDGYEIISHPCTLDYHLHTADWRGIMQTARRYGYLSHDTDTCGLHVHISRRMFGEAEEDQALGIAKLQLIINAVWDDLVRFSRRKPNELNRWCAYYDMSDARDTDDMIHKANCKGDRYYALNTEPSDTVEFRLYRGTLNYETFALSLKVLDVMVRLANSKTLLTCQRMTWDTIIGYVS